VPEEKGLIERSMAKSSKIFSTESWARQRGISPWRGGQEEEDHDDGGVDLEVGGGGANCEEAPSFVILVHLI
jgi:hypothetical protein